MRRSKVLSALIIALLLTAFIAGACFASKADELLSSADRAVTAAQKATSTADRNDNYQKAIDDYNQVVKKFGDTPQAAQAYYNLGLLYETKKAKDEKEKNNNLSLAHTEYTNVVSRFDKTPQELSQNYERNEVTKIRSIVDQAKDHKTTVEQELDRQNSKNILYKIIDFFVHLTGARPWFSYWFAIILVTLIIKLLITPLTKAQFKAMKEMQKVAPLVKEIQEKYKGDQKEIGERTMALYKEHNINPFASCLPILIQMPILWLLYYMIRLYQFQFVHGKFLWIGSALSHAASVHVPFGTGGPVWITARNLAEPDLILVLLYVVSMYISTKLSAVDPQQAEQQKMMAIVMPLMFAFIFATFQSAFLLYWLVFNIIQTAQQYLILRPQSEAGGGGPTQTPPALPQEPETPEQPKDQTPRVRRRRRR